MVLETHACLIMSGWREISEFVLKNDYFCCVCAGLCPHNVLEMCFNEFGKYKPCR
jgi:hypothetical protein